MHQTTIADDVLSEAIRAFMALELPGDEDLVDEITLLARAFYAQGASVSDTCRWAMELARGWPQHPSRVVPGQRRPGCHLRLVRAAEGE